MGTKHSDNRNSKLQALCRTYLGRLRYMAEKHGLGDFVKDTIAANRRGECEATNHEIELLGRCVDDERVTRNEVPQILGKSYRECNEDGDFDKVKRLGHQGIYSKVSALLLASTMKKRRYDSKRIQAGVHRPVQ